MQMYSHKAKYLIFVSFLFLESCIIVPLKEEPRNDTRTYISEEEYFPEIQYNVFIVYSTHKYKEVKEYRVGEIVGHDYHINYDGEIIEFTNYFNQGSKITKIYSINKSELNNIDSSFKKYDFMNFKPVLPLTNELKWPLNGFTFGYRPSPNHKFKFVNVITTHVDRRFFPDGFFELVSDLSNVLFESR